MPASCIFKEIKLEVFYVLIIGLSVNYLTGKFKDLIPIMPISIPAFIGTAISVILSFKINQFYDRWWEARKIWGSIVNESRTLVLQLQSFVSKNKQNDVKEIAYRHIAWCFSSGQSLRGLDATQNLNKYVSETDIDKIQKIITSPWLYCN